MKKFYILQRSKKVFQSSILFVLLFSFFIGKINAQTYVNGNLNTGPTTSTGVPAPAGTNWSEVQGANINFGYAASITAGAGFTVADDFTTISSWNVTSASFYAYSTGYAGATSPFTDVRVRIYNTNPSVGNPAPIFGDYTTNRFASSTDATMYRAVAAGGTTRRIWKINANISVTLAPGTYWIEWQVGTALASNFSPASTVVGTTTQPGNNALQKTLVAGTWAPIVDAGGPQDMPFSIDYSTGPCSGTPAPGNTIASLPTVCPGIPVSLSLQNPTPGAGVTYQWQSGPSATGPFTNIAGATNSTYSTTIAAVTFFQALVTCSGNTGTSTPVQVASTPPSGCYCAAGSPDVIFEKIGRVQYNTIDNPSTSTAGYENFTAISTTVVQQSTVPITVTITGPFATDKVIVWIDFNQNGNFSDAGEMVYTSAAGNGPHTGNITIPATSTLGSTRMRIRMFDSGFDPNPNSCGNTAYGQVEDYTVNITPCIPLTITTQPANATIQCGGNATFSLTATGSGPAYQWQERTSATALWTNLSNNTTYSGVTTNTLTISNAPVTMNGYQYRAVFSGYCRSTDFTSAATLTVNPYVATVTPTSATICNGSSQQLSITNTLGNVVALSEGFNGSIPPAGWAVKQNSLPLGPTGWFQGDITLFPSNSGAANSYIAADYQNTDPTGIGTISNWLMSPVLNIKNGDIITFYSRIPAGTEYPDRLEVRVSGNGASINVGTTETSVGDFTNLLFTINPTLVTGVYPKVWTQFTATVSGLAAPTTGRVAFRYFVTSAGGNAPNSNYIGIDDVNYISTGALATGVWTGPAGTMFTDAGLTTPYTGTAVNTIYVNPTASTQYSVVVTTATPCVSNPTIIPVTVANPIGTVTPPTNKAICTNGNTTFTVSAASGNPIVYQWQVSTDGGATWTNIANAGVYTGATTGTLTLTGVPSTYNNYQYRAILTVSACSSTVTTAAATLTVNPLPVVVINAGPTTQLYPGITTTLTAAVSPNAAASYQWYHDGIAVPGATAATIVVDVDGLGDYSVSVVDVNGCEGSSNSISVTAAKNDIMFIYPSPTTGIFQVRYYSAPGNNQVPRSVTIYDSKGARVYTQTFNINVPYGKIEVDMTNHARGIYRVELSDRSGNRIKTGSVLIL